jgi:hypothetical protein
MSKFFCNRDAWQDSKLFPREQDIITPDPPKKRTQVVKIKGFGNVYKRRIGIKRGGVGELTQGIIDALSERPMRFGEICAKFPGNLRQNIKCSLETIHRRGLLVKEGTPGRNLSGNEGYLFKIIGVVYPGEEEGGAVA